MSVSDRAEAGGFARSHPALTDARTGLANALHFDLVYNYLFEAGHRGLPFSVMLVYAGSEDEAGDDEIRKVGLAIEQTTRNSDLVSHLGSGRYVVLLLGTNLQGGRIAADRVEVALDGLAPGAVSFGLAAYHEDIKEPGALLERADKALLAAEAAGGGVEFG